ncbi:MAG TPA: PorP/SprF family type IX secretion system membrane protein [Bacteroidia bacterium]
MKAKLIISVFLCLMVSLYLKAQDPHLTQYDAFPVYLNPSLTGNYLGEEGDYRISSVYRTQWRALTPKPYTTYGVAYDQTIKRFGVGGYILDDKSGAGNYNTMNVQLSGSYLITDPKTSPHLLSTGVQLGIFYKSFNPNSLLFDSQYDNATGTLNPAINSGENFQKTSLVNFDANMGVFYKYRDVQKKWWPYVGLSLFHINQPRENFGGYSSRLPIRWDMQTGCDFTINEKIKLTPTVRYMNQARASELNMGVLLHYRLGGSKEVKHNLHQMLSHEQSDSKDEVRYDLIVGLNYRLKDAMIFQVGIKKDNITLRMSYDINTSYLNSYTGGKGGFEMTLIIIGKKGVPLFQSMSKY